MKLIAEKLGRYAKFDHLRFIRMDGSETNCSMPRQGTLPHDLIHFVVESMLPLKHGFLSLVAAGSDAGFVMQAVHDPTNLAVGTEAAQTESIVEALQTQLWSNTFDNETFLEAVRLSTISRGIEAFDFFDAAPDALYAQARLLLEQWSLLPFHQSLELEFPQAKGLCKTPCRGSAKVTTDSKQLRY